MEWCGMRCLEFVEPVDKNKKLGGISRLLVTKSHVYCVSILGFDSEPPADLRAAGFEGFNLLSGDAVDRDSEAVLVDLAVRWEAHEFPRHKFKASFSGQPTTDSLSDAPRKPGGMPMSTRYRAKSGLDVIETTVMVYDLRPGLSRIARAAMIEEVVEAITKKAKADERDSSDAIEVTLDGQPAQEITISKNKSGDVARLLTTESHLYLLVINSQNRWPTADERRTFFDSFHVLK
jgi:hypothetical protein